MVNIFRLFRVFALLFSTNTLYYLIQLYIKKDSKKKELIAIKFGISLSKLLTQAGPAFIKLGQLLSTRPDIVGVLISNQLSNLQDNLPQCNLAKILPTIEKSFQKNINEIFQVIDEKAIAAASIAQVHKAVTIDGRIVAVKILRPNIEKKFRKNLSLLNFIAKLISKIISSTQRLKLVEVINTMKKISSIELDLRLEAASADKLRSNCKEDHEVYIPQIFWDYTNKKIMTMEWIDGISINNREKILSLKLDPYTIISNLLISFFKQAFRDGFFHADLHPGNIMINQKGEIILLDFGIIGILDYKNRLFVAEIIWCFIKRDYDRAAQLHFEANYVPANQSKDLFALACRSIGESVIEKSIEQISTSQLFKQLFSITEQFQMETQPQLLLLQKTMITLEGLGHLLCPEINMWSIISPWMKKWAKHNIGPKARISRLNHEFIDNIGKILSIIQHTEALLDNAVKKNNSSFFSKVVK